MVHLLLNSLCKFTIKIAKYCNALKRINDKCQINLQDRQATCGLLILFTHSFLHCNKITMKGKQNSVYFYFTSMDTSNSRQHFTLAICRYHIIFNSTHYVPTESMAKFKIAELWRICHRCWTQENCAPWWLMSYHARQLHSYSETNYIYSLPHSSACHLWIWN